MQPSEFWNLSLTEFWWEFDARLKAQKEVEKIRGKTSPNVKGGITEEEWAAARKKFSEKQHDTVDRPSR